MSNQNLLNRIAGLESRVALLERAQFGVTAEASQILQAVSAHTRIPVQAIVVTRRRGRGPTLESEARFLAALLMRDAGFNYSTIAPTLGWTDHSTAMHGVRRGRMLAETCEKFMARYQTLSTQLARHSLAA